MNVVRNEMEKAVGKKWTKRIGVLCSALLVYLILSFVTGIWPFSVSFGLAKKVVDPESIV